MYCILRKAKLVKKARRARATIIPKKTKVAEQQKAKPKKQNRAKHITNVRKAQATV